MRFPGRISPAPRRDRPLPVAAPHAVLGAGLLARHFLSEADYEYLFDSIRLLAFELGVRFFTDYLAGNVYFKVKHPQHNLLRALVQFRLTESVEAYETEIRCMIQNMAARAI